MKITSGGGDFKHVFHAGFHDAGAWPEDENSLEMDHFMRACISRVLQMSADLGLRSVAFPLIGCGLDAFAFRLETTA